MKFDDNEMSARLNDSEALPAQLSNDELELIQGGAAPFNPEETEQVKGIINNASQHHGVNRTATVVQAAWGTVLSFGAYAAGEAAMNKAKKKN